MDAKPGMLGGAFRVGQLLGDEGYRDARRIRVSIKGALGVVSQIEEEVDVFKVKRDASEFFSEVPCEVCDVGY